MIVHRFSPPPPPPLPLFVPFLKENIVLISFDVVKTIFKSNFEMVVNNQAFPDFISCLVEFCKNRRFTKTSLQSIEVLRQSITRMVEFVKTQQPKIKSIEDLKESSNGTPAMNSPASTITPLPNMGNIVIPASIANGIKISPDEDPHLRFWFPILFGLYEIIMTCDLEVRTR